jgi:excisionase family DNA binding protein
VSGPLLFAASADGGRTGANAPLLTVREVAARLRVCTAVVYRLVSTGALPHVRVMSAIRVAEEDLDAFQRAGGGAP